LPRLISIQPLYTLFPYTTLFRSLLDSQTGLLKIHALDFPGHQLSLKQEITVSRDTSPSGQAIGSGQPFLARGKVSRETVISCLRDRKSTRLNFSHGMISYAVFFL